MKKRMAVLSIAALAGAAGLVGCSGQATQVSVGGDLAAGPVAKSPDDYRKLRFEEAMRGLVIQDGAVVVDAAGAPDIVSKLSGGNAALAVSRGHALMGENDFSGAVGEYRNAIIADPGLASGYEGLGDALIGKKKDDMALAAYRTAVSHAPEDTALRMKLAETINRTGDIAGWASELENVLSVDPAHGEAHARLAVARYYLGDREAARDEIALAERFGGNVPPQLKAMLIN